MTERVIVAEGSGQALSEKGMNSSMRAESYGLLTATRFVLHAARWRKKEPKKVLVWSDSETLIKRLVAMTRVRCNPREYLRGNADTCSTIRKTLQELKNFELRHVFGHQDKDCKDFSKLPWEAQLNIRADFLATRERFKYSNDPVLHFPMAGPLLRIGRIVVTSRLRASLTEAAEKQEMTEYIRGKYKWNKETFDLVAWKIHGQALSKVNVNLHKIIVRMIYGWLPTGKRLHRQDENEDHRCPLCKQVQEDNLHMFHCQHKTMRAQQETMVKCLRTKMENSATDPKITRILSEGVEKWMKDKKFEMSTRATGKMKTFVEQQNRIGWDQIVCGRTSKEVIKVQEKHLIENKHITKVHRDANRWLRIILQTLWESTGKIWKTRCEEKYGKNREDKIRIETLTLRRRVEECYKKKNMLLHNYQKLFKANINTLITKSNDVLEAWLNTVEPLLQANNHLEGQTRMTEYFKQETDRNKHQKKKGLKKREKRNEQ